MKTLIKKTLLVLMVAFIAVFTLGVSSKVKAASYVESDFGEGKYLITTVFNGDKYYLPATTTNQGPALMFSARVCFHLKVIVYFFPFSMLITLPSLLRTQVATA